MSERPPLRGRSALVANPVLVGAAGLLITIVAFVLAYNANSGLPFVQTYDVRVAVPDAASLVVGNDVREGGARIGQLSAIEPLRERDGREAASLVLKLDRKVGPLPEDTQIRIRPRSPLGLRYVELTRGHSKRMVASGGSIRLSHAAPVPVEFDDFFSLFDVPTRTALPEATDEFGAAIAGRGAGLNAAIHGLLPLVTHLEPAARNLADPRTGFARLMPALARAAAEVAPVAEQQARLFTALSVTFGALSGVRNDLMATISYGPRALKAGTEELPKQARFMRAATELTRRLRPGLAALGAAAPDLDVALRAGAPALRRMPALNRRLIGSFADLERFNDDQRVHTGLQALADSAVGLRPLTSFVTPAQTVCNYGGLLLRNLAGVFSRADAVGSMMQASIVLPSNAPGSEGGPTAVPSHGPDPVILGGLPQDNYLHSNPLPNTAAPGQPRECESGNEGYVKGKPVVGNVPGNQGTLAEKTGRFTPAKAGD